MMVERQRGILTSTGRRDSDRPAQSPRHSADHTPHHYLITTTLHNRQQGIVPSATCQSEVGSPLHQRMA